MVLLSVRDLICSVICSGCCGGHIAHCKGRVGRSTLPVQFWWCCSEPAPGACVTDVREFLLLCPKPLHSLSSVFLPTST